MSGKFVFSAILKRSNCQWSGALLPWSALRVLQSCATRDRHFCHCIFFRKCILGVVTESRSIYLPLFSFLFSIFSSLRSLYTSWSLLFLCFVLFCFFPCSNSFLKNAFYPFKYFISPVNALFPNRLGKLSHRLDQSGKCLSRDYELQKQEAQISSRGSDFHSQCSCARDAPTSAP